MIYETDDYEVVITKEKHRREAQSELDVFFIRNKTHNTIEALAGNKPLAISTCVAIQDALDSALQEKPKAGRKKHGSITVLSGKDYPL